MLLILIAGTLWGTIGIFVRRFTAEGLSSPEIVAERAVFTALFMFIFLFFYDRRLLRIRLKDLWCFIGTGLLSMVFFNLCYFRLITISSLSVAAVMLYTAPAFVIVLSAVLFRERITAVKLLALVLTVVGCAFTTGIVGSPVSLPLNAILLGLGAGLGYGLYSIFGRYALERGYHSFTISFYTFLIVTLGLLPVTGVSNLARVCLGSPFMLGFSVLCGLVTTVIPYITYNFGLAKVETGKAAIIASIEPVVATLIGLVVFRETLSAGNVLGMAMVLTAIALCSLKGK